MPRSLLVPSLLLLGAPSTCAWAPRSLPPTQRTGPYHRVATTASVRLAAYGRGAEIWPPSSDEAVRLVDSFPNNVLPPHIEAVLRQSDDIPANGSPSPAVTPASASAPPSSPSWRASLSKILRRAAARSQSEALVADDSSRAVASTPVIDRTPALLALSLLPYLKPLDLLLAAFLSGYLLVLLQLSRQPRAPDNEAPLLPALPPQGHVPYLLANPLGHALAQSVAYSRWLHAGVVLGLLAPLAAVVRDTLQGRAAAASLAARPLALLCLQAVLESGLARRRVPSPTPLPLRVLASVACHTVRLGYLWQWALTTDVPLGAGGRLLAILNLLYWAANLFGFLIPVGVMRYMRAHFFCVEAEQVITRPGLQESVGLLQ